MNPSNPARNFFLHLLQFLAFYWSMIAITTILFQYLNIRIPDALSYMNPIQPLRWAVSTLVVTYPVFVAITRLFRREGMPNPKFAVYLTLFAAGVTMIIDVGTLIYQYLGGELTERFGLKILSVLVVAACVFIYFIWDLRRGTTPVSIRANQVLWGVDAVVLLVIIGAFVVVGSPAKQRQIRFDEQRVSDLQNIQWQVINYWQTHGTLPSTLEPLTSDLVGFRVPTDPFTKAAYEYTTSVQKKFSLCATFALPSVASASSVPKPFMDGSQSFTHAAGRVCFDREIDEKQFPVNKL